jgi:hypothetical protein
MGRGRSGGGRGATRSGGGGGNAALGAPISPTARRGIGRGPQATDLRSVRGTMAEANASLALFHADRLNESRLWERRYGRIGRDANANPNTPRNVASSGRVQPRDAVNWVDGYREGFTNPRSQFGGSAPRPAYMAGFRAAQRDLLRGRNR